MDVQLPIEEVIACLGQIDLPITIKWDTKNNVVLIGEELGWFGHQVEGCHQVPTKSRVHLQGMRDFSKYVSVGMVD